jgi:hypothetical protein
MKKAKITLAAIIIISGAAAIIAFKSARDTHVLFLVAKNSTTTVTLLKIDLVSTPTFPGEATTPLPTIQGYTAITGWYTTSAPTNTSPTFLAYNAGE